MLAIPAKSEGTKGGGADFDLLLLLLFFLATYCLFDIIVVILDVWILIIWWRSRRDCKAMMRSVSSLRLVCRSARARFEIANTSNLALIGAGVLRLRGRRTIVEQMVRLLYSTPVNYE